MEIIIKGHLRLLMRVRAMTPELCIAASDWKGLRRPPDRKRHCLFIQSSAARSMRLSSRAVEMIMHLGPAFELIVKGS